MDVRDRRGTFWERVGGLWYRENGEGFRAERYRGCQQHGVDGVAMGGLCAVGVEQSVRNGGRESGKDELGKVRACRLGQFVSVNSSVTSEDLLARRTSPSLQLNMDAQS